MKNNKSPGTDSVSSDFFQFFLNIGTFVMRSVNYSYKTGEFSLVQRQSIITLGPNINWTSNYGTGIVFIGNLLSWLSFHNFV